MKKLTIAEIQEKLETITDTTNLFVKKLAADDRKGVQQTLTAWFRQREHEKLIHEKFVEMSQYEDSLRKQGYRLIAGIDEAGRGPLAGPVTAAAVILPEQFCLPGIDDSKKLTEQKREEYYRVIMSEAVAVSVEMVDAAEIDRINILEAAKKAMLSAVAHLQPKPDFLLVDAVKLTIPYPYEAIIKGDAKSISIAAASIIAKVTRDHYMKQLDGKYPQYGFAKNRGYGTKDHLSAIEKYGITPYHRKSFSPVKEYIQESE